MNQRARIVMTGEEVATLLKEGRKLQLATINQDGTPHLVTMFYGLSDDGRLIFWTYAKAQKSRNIERDPRVTCLVEVGDDYGDLRGATIYGTALPYDDVMDAGMRVTARMTGQDPEPMRPFVEMTGRKRVAYIVEPGRVVSWDHRKLHGSS
ncbi:pyridoxamine 5'-phosphate oxidase family protein [Herbidospora yilanensis]|uniref:pyridoxamine 5'-phosphate oxidase family protein n=1 Tax=Herbidospora yilanensis TaxID=354426 RepID=UPI000782E325|nr:pyridoxamine 5'-phosphate oxidase family protein [Herbidospora yilanensis]